jgi:hypothetical protein
VEKRKERGERETGQVRRDREGERDRREKSERHR